MNSTFFTVSPSHELAYNHIVKPHRRWAFSYYFLHRWLPLLHPQQAMVIQVLRQSSWQNGRPTGGCQLTNATLCAHLGWSDTSHKTLLAELERPHSNWFVTRERTRKRHVTEGHGVEGAPRYRVQMDDPLTPRDQAAVATLLATHRPATPYAAAELLATLAQQRTRDLWAQLDAQSASLAPAKPVTVAALATSAWSHLPPAQLNAHKPFVECAEQLQLRLTGVGYAHMELDYLLRGWLPTLGINNTWLVITLRARCFHDPQTGETRDIAIVSRRDLEKQLNIPERTFRRVLRDETTVPLFSIAPVGEAMNPLEPRTIPHRGDLAFHVAYPLLPIAPTDRATYEQFLLGTPTSLSTSGHTAHLMTVNQPVSPVRVINSRQENPSDSGQSTHLTMTETVNAPISMGQFNPAEKEKSGTLTHLKAVIQPDIPNILKEQSSFNSKNPISLPPLEGGRHETEKVEIRRLLEPFAIQGIASILQNKSLTATEVQGWIYRAQDEVEPSQMGGYLFRRLRVNSDIIVDDPLPTRYQLMGNVQSNEGNLFEEWWLDELAPPPFTDDSQRERYGAWLQVVKHEEGNPDRPDYSARARFRRELARS
jgi:hypothetical protein